MPAGPGKYDDACTAARLMTGGGVVLIVAGGEKGDGFAAQLQPGMGEVLPLALRQVATQIDESIRAAAAAAGTQAPRAPLEEAEIVARRLGHMIGDVTPPGWGFVLLLNSWGEGGFSTYISNAERTSTIKLLREMAEKIERNDPEA